MVPGAPDLAGWISAVVREAVQAGVGAEAERLARQNEIFTADQAAAYLQVTPATIYREVRLGRLPGQKIGAHLRLSRAALDAVLAGEQRPARLEAIA